MRKLEDYSGDQARSYKKYQSRTHGNRKDFEDDLQFNENPNKYIKQSESKSALKNIKDQIDYFGYEIEPFHMKNERDIGNFDQGGYFVFDKEKDKNVNDAWLDQLDQSNVFQELQEKAQNENAKKIKKQIKEANKSFSYFKKKQRGDDYFKSSRFNSKEEAEAFYNNQLNDEEEEQQLEVETINKVEDKSKDDIKIQEMEEKGPNLEDLTVNQLKEILYELLKEGENSQQAMKRIRNEMGLTERKVFKKNVRKNQKQETQQEITISNEKENEKQSLNMIVDICTIIVEKTNDPNIYNTLKEDLIPIEQQNKNFDKEDDIF